MRHQPLLCSRKPRVKLRSRISNLKLTKKVRPLSKTTLEEKLTRPNVSTTKRPIATCKNKKDWKSIVLTPRPLKTKLKLTLTKLSFSTANRSMKSYTGITWCKLHYRMNRLSNPLSTSHPAFWLRLTAKWGLSPVSRERTTKLKSLISLLTSTSSHCRWLVRETVGKLSLSTGSSHRDS